MRVIVLVNAKAGSVGEAQAREQVHSLRESFSAHGIDAEVRPVPGARLAGAAREAAGSGVDAVVAGGGDGTISTVSGAMLDAPAPMGVLPLGTLNHFAKDLGVPTDMDGAIRVIAARHERRVDVGEVNGRVFINNSSIGLYPRIVRDRDEQRTRLGRGKWLAMFFASISALRRFPVIRVRIGVGEQSVLRTTPFVFVGNNQYEMTLFNVRDRTCLDAGHLSLYVANRTGRFGMFKLALRALFGRLDQAKDFESACLTELWIETGKRRLQVALDGEVATMTPPLHYMCRPRALRVLAPPVHPAEAASAGEEAVGGRRSHSTTTQRESL